MKVNQVDVNDELNNALENGYDMRRMRPEEVAVDLMLYSSVFEDIETEDVKDLLQAIKYWQEKVYS